MRKKLSITLTDAEIAEIIEESQPMKYILTDTFNNKELSRHSTLPAAIDARHKHLRAVKKANGENSYLTYAISRSDAEPIDEGELYTAEWQADKKRFT